MPLHQLIFQQNGRLHTEAQDRCRCHSARQRRSIWLPPVLRTRYSATSDSPDTGGSTRIHTYPSSQQQMSGRGGSPLLEQLQSRSTFSLHHQTPTLSLFADSTSTFSPPRALPIRLFHNVCLSIIDIRPKRNHPRQVLEHLFHSLAKCGIEGSYNNPNPYSASTTR